MERLKHILALTAGFLLIAGCGGIGGTTGSGAIDDPANIDGDPATTSLAIKLASSSGGAPALMKGAEDDAEETFETSDASSGTITITSARVSLERIDLKLSDDLDCVTLAFTLEDGECSEEAEEDDVDEALSALWKRQTDDEEEGDDEGEEEDDDADDEGEDEAEEEDDDHIRIEGPFVLDMMTGESNPSLAEVVVPSGTYRRIELKVNELDEDSGLVAADDPLVGNSLVVGGTYDDGETVGDFMISLDFDEKVRFENETGFVISEVDDLNEIVVSLNINDWFAGIDLGACLAGGDVMADENGVFIIDEDNDGGECNFTDELKQAIKDSGEVDRDDDDDEDEEDDDDDEDEEDDDEDEDEDDAEDDDAEEEDD